MYLWIDIGICTHYFTDATVCAASSELIKQRLPQHIIYRLILTKKLLQRKNKVGERDNDTGRVKDVIMEGITCALCFETLRNGPWRQEGKDILNGRWHNTCAPGCKMCVVQQSIGYYRCCMLGCWECRARQQCQHLVVTVCVLYFQVWIQKSFPRQVLQSSQTQYEQHILSEICYLYFFI